MFKLYSKDIIAATSSKGNQEKWYDKNSNNWYKLDTGSFEAYAETVASCLLSTSNIEKELGFKIVEYHIEQVLVHGKSQLACVSENFLQEGQELITLAHLLKRVVGADYQKTLFSKRNTIPQNMKILVDEVVKATKLEGFGAYLTLLLECDMLILNEDRHLNNIAVIHSANGYDYCPLFDNGISFLLNPDTYPLDVNANAFIKQVRAKPFNCSFSASVRAARSLYGRQLILPKNLSNFYETANETVNSYPKLYHSYLVDRVCDVVKIQRMKL